MDLLEEPVADPAIVSGFDGAADHYPRRRTTGSATQRRARCTRRGGNDQHAGRGRGRADDALTAFEATWAREIEEKAEAEASAVAQKKAKAEEELDKFYDERTDKKAQRAATNREHEQAQVADTERLARESSSGNPFARIVALVDTQVSEKASEGPDVSRMRRCSSSSKTTRRRPRLRDSPSRRPPRLARHAGDAAGGACSSVLPRGTSRAATTRGDI